MILQRKLGYGARPEVISWVITRRGSFWGGFCAFLSILLVKMYVMMGFCALGVTSWLLEGVSWDGHDLFFFFRSFSSSEELIPARGPN